MKTVIQIHGNFCALTFEINLAPKLVLIALLNENNTLGQNNIVNYKKENSNVRHLTVYKQKEKNQKGADEKKLLTDMGRRASTLFKKGCTAREA